ncbi:TonB-dependent receptor [Asticcacaulis sp. 201]|uniref:TonB-dependent receptor n=1 Tax=Asticcacaulis sp. 201 TaxID=3028787 RepID=UPI0029166F47|nr:TonB-dependent receptor [Asticcacaulis sp. 201]MDV6331138.1 TonB-dependent receptor [Asticcacaulis sp. 201]
MGAFRKPALRSWLLASTALAVWEASAASTLAQTTTTAPSDETVVVVTAQKRKEPLQKVPTSIQVVSGEKIDQQAIDTYKDVIQMMSGVTIREHSDPRNVGLIIRGVGSNQSFIGIEPDAAVNLDGEVMSRSSALFGDIGDTDSIAVLKGPQGTLFGKNSVAGVMQIKTKRPSLKGNEGAFRLLADQGMTQTFGEINASGMYNYVIDPDSAVRINLFDKKDSGWVENVKGGPNGGATKGYGGRVQYLHKFGDDTDLLLRADYQKSTFGPSTRVYLQRDDFTIGNAFGQIPQSVIDSLHLSAADLQKLLTTNLQYLSQTPSGPDNHKTSASAVRDYGGTHSFGLSEELTHRFGSGYELNWATFYRDETLTSNDDTLSTWVNAFPLNFSGPVQSKTFQSELRLASPIGPKFDYVAGLFYLHSKVRRDQRVLACQDPGLDNSTIDANGNVTNCGGYAFGWDVVNPGVTGLGDLIYNREIHNNNLITDNAAIFAQGNYHFTDKLTLTVGGRLLQEHQRFALDIRDDGIQNVDVRPTLLWINDANGDRIVFPGGRFNVPNPFYGLPSNNPATNLDVRNPNTPLRTASKSSNDTAFTYKAALQFQATRDVMTYLSYSTGYKGVAWFTDSDVGQQKLDTEYPIAPETSQNLELGVRSQWFNRRLTFNATLFDTTFYHYQDRLVTLDYDLFPIVHGGLQNIANDPLASGQPIRRFDIVDTGNLNSKGVDVEMNWRVLDHLTLSANYSHVDARFSNTNVLITCNAAISNGASASACTAPLNYGEFFDYTFPRRGRFFSLNGAQLANAPTDTLAADAVVDFKVHGWSSYLRWNYRYASEQYTNHGGKANNDYSTTTPAYGIHNLFLGVASPSGKYRFNVYVKNLMDKHYYVYKTNYGDGLAENAVGGSLTTVPELVGIAQAYPTYGAVPNGQFFRHRAENADVPRDFGRYVGATFEMSF